MRVVIFCCCGAFASIVLFSLLQNFLRSSVLLPFFLLYDISLAGSNIDRHLMRSNERTCCSRIILGLDVDRHWRWRILALMTLLSLLLLLLLLLLLSGVLLSRMLYWDGRCQR